MINDSNSVKGVHPAPVATLKRVESEELSRFEGEGGPEEPEQQIEDQRQPDRSTWEEIVSRYQKPDIWRGVWQVINTLVPYAWAWLVFQIQQSE